MPCVQIHMIRGVRTPEEIKKLADVVQQTMLDKFNAPARDRYQVCIVPVLKNKSHICLLAKRCH